MFRVAIFVVLSAIFALLGTAAGWWADNRPLLGAVIGFFFGMGIAILAIVDETFRGRHP